MGVQKTFIENNQRLAIWDCVETCDTLLNNSKINAIEKTQFDAFTNERRRSEYLATRQLLQEINPGVDIVYDEKGRPSLSNGQYISISHSHGKVFVGISDSAIGVDVELLRDKILKIQHKFLHPSEWKYMDNMNTLTLIWTVKESVFKYYSKKVFLDFKNDIQVENINTNTTEGKVIAKITNTNVQEVLNLKFFKIDDHLFTYTLNN